METELTLCPVTRENRKLAESLTVGPGQEGFVEPVAECMEEADRIPQWEPVLLYRADCPIGFAMYGYMSGESRRRLWFDRLLIDRHYQGKGYGRGAVAAILAQLRREFPGKAVYLSAYDSNQVAIRLYQSFGFRFNGELDYNGERVMVLEASVEE